VLDGLLIGIVPLVHPEWTWRNHDDWHGWNLRMLRADDSQKVKRIFHAAIVSHLRTIGALMTRAARSSTHFTASAAVRDPACLQPAFLRNLEEFAPNGSHSSLHSLSLAAHAKLVRDGYSPHA
jgi:hypothetical protein